MSHTDGLASLAKKAIRSFGQEISREIFDELKSLYAPLLLGSGATSRVERDVAYGEHPRCRLNLFLPTQNTHRPVDVLLFVHGGGFVSGDKEEMQGAFHDNVGLWAAANGMVGAIVNYRLAPDHTWPSGRDDVAAAADWLALHAGEYGGNPGRLFVMGHSAGGAHVSAFIGSDAGRRLVAGGILVSGLYDLTLPPVSVAYFGDDESRYVERSPLPALARATTPLLLTTAEFDPKAIQVQFAHALSEILDVRGTLPMIRQIAGHNHFSTILHMHTLDHSLGQAILGFTGTVRQEGG